MPKAIKYYSDEELEQKLKELEYKIVNRYDSDQRIISKIAHIERFAEPNVRTQLTEFHRRLTIEKPLLRRGEETIQIRKKTIKLKRIRIPICQERHLNDHTHES